MYLKKIELFGFKSFADKTEITFERGVTCVVGPNGCGKSNISDSIRWVLGERSAKLLRGSKMEDVIFSGTDFRKPLNFAEVSLTIDNSDQKLAIQYEEVVITRKLHRSGESEYLLNKTPCRLKDIQDLILDTGIGSNSYSMIEQGRLDHILNAEAEERRSLIEEAAGISKYKVKKEEALRKLERTEENLVRLNDITSEVERNIRYAERQAQRAERYKDQLEQLKKLEIQKAFFEFGVLDEKFNMLKHERNEQNAQLNALEEVLSQEHQSVREIEHRIYELEQAFLEQESSRSDVKQELASLEGSENFQREKTEFLNLTCERALGEIESLTKRLDSLNNEIQIKRNEYDQVSQLIEKTTSEKNQKEASLKKQIPSHSEEGSHEFSDQQTALFDLARQVSELKNSLNKNHAETLAAERAKKVLQESKIKLTKTKEVFARQLTTVQEERAALEIQLSTSQNTFGRLNEEKEALGATVEASQKDLQGFRTEKTKLEHQILLLQELDSAHGPDPKQVIAEHGSHQAQKGMLKGLLDLIHIESGYELAVEAALYHSLKAVVAENAKAAAHLLLQMKEGGTHHATIFIKDRAILNGSVVESEKHPLIQKRLWDIIHIQKGYEGIFGHLLGKAYVVDEITPENILELAPLAERLKLVSKSGAVYGPEYQIVLRNGGYTPQKSVLARAKELEILKKGLIAVSGKEESLSTSLKEKEARLKTIIEEEKIFNHDNLNSRMTWERLEANKANLNELMRQAEENIKLLDREKKENLNEAEQLDTEKQKLLGQLTTLEARQSQTQTALDAIRKQSETEKNTSDTIERDLTLLLTKLESQCEKAKELEKTLNFLEREATEAQSRIKSLSMERQTSFGQIERLKDELNTLYGRKTQTIQLLLERSVEVENVKRERNELIAKRNEMMEKNQVTVSAASEARQKTHEYSLREMEITHQKDSIVQNLRNRYKLNLLELNQADYQIKADEVEPLNTELERLREKLEAIGTVNLLAIDEYQEMKGRYEFLLNQKRDLTEARDSLLEAIRKINRTTKKLFEETLGRVRESFREYFRILFGGGQADLILLD
ncbi:MAG: chromosome segregation protein SMC, partial [Omnitrophica bacterium RIFCSPHIGHO2_02_FULL_46_11]